MQELKTFRLTTTHLAVTNPKLVFQQELDCLVYPVGWIGINLASASRGQAAGGVQSLQASNAVRISRVWRRSPAEQAGLQAGDVITAVNGQAVTNKLQVRAVIIVGLDQPITLSLQRAGEQEIVSLTPTQPPNPLLVAAIPTNVQAPLYEATRQLIADGYEKRIAPGQRTEGEIALEQLARSHPSCAAIFNNLAFLHECKDEMSEAIHHYQRAVELDPQAALYHFNLGLALRSIGNWDRAVEELEQAVTLSPAWWLAARWLSDAYTLVGCYADAVNAVDAGLQWNPLSADLFVEKAEVLLRAQQPEAALLAAQKAVELEPAHAMAQTVLGTVSFDLGRIDDAEAAFRKAIELGPSDNSADANLANLLREQRGQLDEAEALHRKALALEPDDATSFNGLGLVMVAGGNLREAEKMFRTLLARAAGLPASVKLQALVNLASVCGDQGKLDEAEKTLKKALELAGENPPAAEIREHLKKVAEKKEATAK